MRQHPENTCIDNDWENELNLKKRKISTCVLLSIFTLGIYQIYWLIQLVKSVKRATGDKSSPVKEILCLIFVPLYPIYWWFTRGKAFKNACALHGYEVTENENAFLILEIFWLSIISMAILQNDLNSLPSEAPKKKAAPINLKYLLFASLMAALSILFGKFLAISIGSDIRISFENLPLFIVSVFLGPVWGMATGIVADLVGCVLRGYAIIPLITVAQAIMGFLPGFLVRVVFRKVKPFPIVLSIALTHLIVSIGMKTAVLHYTYGMPFLALLGWRSLSYGIIIPLEAYLCVLLARNKTIRNLFGLSN